MDLTPLLAPRSIAVVGATDRPDSYAGNVLRNLQRSGFSGPVWGVNPKRAEVLGRKCVPALADLPQPVDAVVVAIPAVSVPDTLSAAAERGCGGAVVLSAGFGEIEAGRELERELRRVAIAADLPVCGPNGNGVIAVGARAAMWGDSVKELEPGGVALISQSGNVAVNAVGSRRGIDYHTVVSTGNQTVLDASDWLSAICRRDGVRSVAMFLESDGDGARLAEALAEAAERGIRVAVLKVGGSERGARAASAHTGALAGDQRVFRSLVEEAGGAWASDFHELLELGRALGEPRARPIGSGGLAILTCSGGDSGVAADEAERLGIGLPELAPETAARLEPLLPEAATVGNPLDYTAVIWGETERLRRIVATVGDDPAIDQLLLLYDHPEGLEPDAEASWGAVRAGLASGAIDADAAGLIASTLPDLLDDESARELGRLGVPAIAGLPSALLCAQALRAPEGDPARLREIGEVAVRARGRPLAGNDGWVGEAKAKGLLRQEGIPVPDGRLARDEGDAVAAADEVGWPVAMKVSGPRVLHKSELGAVALGLGGEDELREAYGRLAGLPVAEGAEVLVERMAEPGVEVLVAATADGVVPALVLALGGIWAEALDDVVVVPLPADAARVERGLRSLRGAVLLTGGRGREGVDVAALAELAAHTGELLMDQGLGLLELNPVVARPDGAIVVDALARA